MHIYQATSHSSKCDSCDQLFGTERGLKKHQSRLKNLTCHRLQTNNIKDAARNEYVSRNERIKGERLQKYQRSVSMGPHPKGSPVIAKEKRCILNLYQSYVDEGKSEKDAKDETARRLGFGFDTVKNAIKEMLAMGDVTDNKASRVTPNAYEKLDEEEIEDIRKIIHNEMKKCTVKRMTEENKDISYPTLASVHQAVMDTERYPSWSVTTFRNVMLQMGIKFQTKSEADRAILIEDQYIIDWRDKFLKNMEWHRIQGRPIHYCDETACYPQQQPRKLLRDITVRSAMEAKEKDLSPGLKWNSGKGVRLLILGMISPNGWIDKLKKIWIHTKGKVQSDDYHNNIDAETFYEWFKEVLSPDILPPDSVIVIDNASIHNKREEGTPRASTRKGDMLEWLIEKDVEFPAKALKAQIWEIVKEHLKTCPEYSIDKLVKELRPDVTIERSPPYHCELNAIEPV